MDNQRPRPSGRFPRAMARRNFLRGAAAGLGTLGLGALACGTRSTPASPSAGGMQATVTPTIATGPPASVKASYTGTPFDVALFLARDQGIFQQHNLDVSLTTIAGPTSVAALLSGQIQYDHPGGPEILAAAVNGADLVVIAVLSTVFNFKFYARPGINAVSDLKGKKLGITSAGGAFDLALRLAMPIYGLQPDKDVTLVAAGSIANVVAALLTGAIDGAAIVVGPDSQKVEDSGIKALFDFADLKLQQPGTVIALQRSYVAAHHAEVQRYTDAIVLGIARYKADRPTSLQELGKIYQTSNQAGLNVAYDYYTRDAVMPKLPFPKVEQFKSPQDVLCQREQKACGFDATKIIDASFIQSAADRGLGK